MENHFSGRKCFEGYFTVKIASAISMITHAISQGVRFDYVFCDSWFTCYELIKFIKQRRIKCHLLGMVKNGTAKYTFNDKGLTAKETAGSLVRQSLLKRSKLPGYCHSSAVAACKGIEVKLFLKSIQTGAYNVLLTTDTALNFQAGL